MVRLLDKRELLTRADHRTHRRYPFNVVPEVNRLNIWVHYAPKRFDEPGSRALAQTAVAEQAASLAARVGETVADRWTADYLPVAARARVVNLLTISLDDALGVYRGAGHRHQSDQRLMLGLRSASPGLSAGPLPPGEWMLTLSAHAVVTDHCEVSIQIEAEMASTR